MSKRLGLLIVMMLFVSLMTGCFGSDDDSTSTTPATAASVVITGSIPALSAPAGAPNYMVAYGTNYEMGVFNAATMTEITGSAVVISGTTYTATVPAGAANVTAIVVIKHKTTGKIVYSALAGILPTTTAMSTAAVSKVTVSGVNLNGESTALATLARDNNLSAPAVPVSSSPVTTISANVKSTIEDAVTAATVAAVTNAVNSIQIAVNASGVTNTSILNALGTSLTSILNAFVEAVKVASAAITSGQGATTVTVGGTTLTSTSTTADVNSAVNGVTVITVSTVTNPADITVASGTAVTAITFPTTVSVTMSNGTTATKSVVWSTTSTPAYVATTAGTYVFTGTVSGTTLTAKVNVIVGAAAQTVATPTFSPAEGTYTAAQSVTISCATTGASIYYTTDGTTPTTASTAYTTAINVAATTTIKAIAVKTGMTNSAVASALYTVNISLIPVISAERAVKQANGDVVVTWTTNIVTPTAAKVIVRGSVPTPSDPSVTETASTTTSHTVTVTADKLAGAYDKLVISYIIGEDGTSKEILKAAIVDAASVVADPVITPAAGTYTAAQSVTITCATAGASIYYTVDGTTPTSASSLYSAAFNITASATVKAIAIKASMTDSQVVSAAYVINIAPVTKVVTGITLATTEGTVEAETAFTAFPAVTAKYDDNSTATVTTTKWFEGATELTGNTVTKTTAGDYNLTAKYTEGTVEVTAPFVLHVTAKVPVKTLQSIDVTPATLTDMTINGTQAVALKVIANYMTGTVASTEEVTAQATVTASAGTYAAGVYTAGATAGAATLTVTFSGMSKTITVNVTAEAPKVTTVTVTAMSIEENTSTQAVVLVKDQFGATMTTGFALTYAMSNAVASVDLTGKITAGAYSATANTSTLTVTATPTSGTAVTGTAVMTVTKDTTIPKILSVVALSSSQIKVTFSEKMKTSTVDASKFTLYNATSVKTRAFDAAKTSYVLGDNDTTVTLSLDTENDSGWDSILVKIGSYYYFTNGNYGIYGAASLTDIAGNAVNANARVDFTITTEQLSDTVPPALASASYNTSTKVLTLAINEAIKSSSNFDITKVAIAAAGTNDIVLTSSDAVTSFADGVKSVTITLGTTNGTNVNTLIAAGTVVSVKMLAGAMKDIAGNLNVEHSKEITVSRPPILTAASFDEDSLTLTLTWDQAVKQSAASDLAFGAAGDAQLAFEGASAQNITSSNTQLVTSTDPKVVKLIVTGLTLINNDSTPAHKIKLPAGFVKSSDVSATNSAAVATTDTNATLTYVETTTAPLLTAATYNNSTKTLVLTFDKNVKVSNTDVVESNFSIRNVNADGTVGSTNLYKPGTSTAAAANEWDGLMNSGNTANSTTITVVLPSAADETKDIDQYANDGKEMRVVLAASFVASAGGTASVATTATGAVTTQNEIKVTVTDADKPALASSTPVVATASKVVQVTFNQAVDATTAQTKTNYVLTLAADAGQTPLTIDSASLETTNKKTVTLTLASAMTTTAANAYKMVVKNVTDAAGNVMTDATALFTGSAGAVNPALVAGTDTAGVTNNKYVIIDKDNSSSLTGGDQIEIIFGSPVKLVETNGTAWTTITQITDKAKLDAIFDFGSLLSGLDSAVLDGASLTVKSGDATRLILTLAKNGTTTDSKGWWLINVGTTTLNLNAALPAVTAASGSQSIVSTIDDTVAVKNGTNQILVAPDLTAPAIESATFNDYVDDGKAGYGDKLVLNYTKKLDTLGTGIDASLFYLMDANNAVNSTVVFDEVDAEKTGDKQVTLTFKDTNLSNNINLNTVASKAFGTFKIQHTETATSLVKDLWNNQAKGGTSAALAQAAGVTVAATNTTSPTLKSAVWYDVNGNGVDAGDQIVFEFTKKVNASSVATTDFVLSTAATWSATFFMHSTDETRLIATLTAIVNINSGTTVDVKGFGASSIRDAYGNKAMNSTAVTLGSNTTADTTAPKVVAVHYYDLRNAGLTDEDNAAAVVGQDGKVDEVVVVFDKPIKDTTIVADVTAGNKWMIGASSANFVDAMTESAAGGVNRFTVANPLDPKVANDQYVTFAVGAGVAWTGPITGDSNAGQVTYVKNATADLQGNLLAAVAAGDITETDHARPKFSSGAYVDTNNDGTIDAVKIVASENVNDSTLYDTNPTLKLNGVNGGAATANLFPATLALTAPTGDVANDSTFYLTLTGGTVSPTAATTLYTTADFNSVAANMIKDAAGNYSLVTSSDIALADGAAPVVTARKYKSSTPNGSVDRLELTFTETLVGGTNTATQSDFAWTANGLTGSALTGAGTGTVATNTLTYTLSTPTTNLTGVSGGTEPTVAYTDDAARAIADAAGNQVASFTAATVADAAAPFLLNFTATDANTLQAKYSESVATNSTLTTKTIFVVDLDGAGAGAAVTSSNITAATNVLTLTCTGHGITANAIDADATLVYTEAATGIIAGSSATDKAVTPQTKTGAVANASL